MDFSLTQLSPSINQANLTKDFGVRMLSNALDMNETLGQNMVAMIDSAAMERSVNPAVGANFDMSV